MAHFRSGECRKGHHGDESYPASLPCGSVEQRYAGEQTSKKECINDALSDGVAWREVAAMKSPLFSEGLRVSDSTAGDSSPVEAGAPLSHAMQEPAVSIELSIGPGYLICLEDGKKFKCLQKHLRTHGLAPNDYRAKWRLPATYPMAAPDYLKISSELRKGVPRA